MDPNAALSELRSLVSEAQQSELSIADYNRGLELVDALDEWLSKGGFLPNAWERNQSVGGDGPVRIEVVSVGPSAWAEGAKDISFRLYVGTDEPEADDWCSAEATLYQNDEGTWGRWHGDLIRWLDGSTLDWLDGMSPEARDEVLDAIERVCGEACGKS